MQVDASRHKQTQANAGSRCQTQADDEWRKQTKANTRQTRADADRRTQTQAEPELTLQSKFPARWRLTVFLMWSPCKVYNVFYWDSRKPHTPQDGRNNVAKYVVTRFSIYLSTSLACIKWLAHTRQRKQIYRHIATLKIKNDILAISGITGLLTKNPCGLS